MLRITIDLIPHGDYDKLRTLYTGYITNDGTGRQKNGVMTHGNYVIELRNRYNKLWRTGRVGNFPRERKNAWYLLCEGLKICLK